MEKDLFFCFTEGGREKKKIKKNQVVVSAMKNTMDSDKDGTMDGAANRWSMKTSLRADMKAETDDKKEASMRRSW